MDGKAIFRVVAPFGLHSGLRQSGSAFGAAFSAGLKPCPSDFWAMAVVLAGRAKTARATTTATAMAMAMAMAMADAFSAWYERGL